MVVIYKAVKHLPGSHRSLLSYFPKGSQPNESDYPCFPNQNVPLSSEAIPLLLHGLVFPLTVIS